MFSCKEDHTGAWDYAIRKVLFWKHLKENPDHAMYGDDGELQCNTCIIDFKHDPLHKLLGR